MHDFTKHSEIIFRGETFENHSTFLGDSFSWNKKAINVYLKNHIRYGSSMFETINIIKPSFDFDQVYVLVYAVNHLIDWE